jgi:bidirectional [NiFe] hydrogenase diaphorase subunit
MDDLANLIDVAKTERSRQKRLRVHCCTSTGCRAASSEAVLTSLQDTIKTEGLWAFAGAGLWSKLNPRHG